MEELAVPLSKCSDFVTNEETAKKYKKFHRKVDKKSRAFESIEKLYS